MEEKSPEGQELCHFCTPSIITDILVTIRDLAGTWHTWAADSPTKEVGSLLISWVLTGTASGLRVKDRMGFSGKDTKEQFVI